MKGFPVLDFGNSSVKAGFYEHGRVTRVERFKPGPEAANSIRSYISDFSPVVAGFSNVSHRSKDEISRELGLVELIEVSTGMKLPFQIHYETPETLGTDRIAAVAGGRQLYPGRALLVIDLGTAVTFDFMDAEDKYYGGSIAPGIDLRFRSLHDHTGRLPLVSASSDFSLTGRSTRQSILNGVMHGMLMEIEGTIESYKREHGNELVVLLTGGDAPYFEKRLKNVSFAIENLVLIGIGSLVSLNIENAS